jgi:integrase
MPDPALTRFSPWIRSNSFGDSDDEIEQIVLAAAQLPSPNGMRALAYSTFFGLVAATGMRMSEGLALDRSDVDLDEGILTIQRTKFGKSRLVPIHPSTRRALESYAEQRDRILRVTTPAFFVSKCGRRITQWSARYHFARVSQQVGLRAGDVPEVVEVEG